MTRPALALAVIVLAAATAVAGPPAVPPARVAAPPGVLPLPPFDLTYLPAVGPQGLAGFRPAQMARHAPAAELDDGVKLMLRMTLEATGADLDAAPLPATADLDQCVFALSMSIQHHGDDKPPGERGSFILGFSTPCVLRTVRPFDWSAAVKEWLPDAKKATHAGRGYLRLTPPFPDLPADAGKLAFFAPDRRTLVVAGEDDIRDLIDRLNDGRPAPAPPPGWEQVETSLVALAFDNRQVPAVVGGWPRQVGRLKPLKLLLGSADVAAVGLRAGPTTELTAVLTTATPAKAAAAARAVRGLLGLARAVPEDELADSLPGGLDVAAADALSNARVRQDGTTVRLTTAAKGDLIKILAVACGRVD